MTASDYKVTVKERPANFPVHGLLNQNHRKCVEKK